MEVVNKDTAEVLLYKTFSLCSRCTLLEKDSALALKSSKVVEKHDKVWLSVTCNIHGSQETLVSNHPAWYKKMWSVSGKSIKESSIADIEDLKTKRKLTPKNRPFIVEISTFGNDSFLNEAEIDSQLRQISLKFPKDTSVTGNLSDDMETLNKQILYIHSKTPAHIVVMVQVSFERLITLANLPGSCFTKGRIYPNVKYYLSKDEEKRCIDEFSQTVMTLKSFNGLRLVVSVSISAPVPDLSSILAFLRVHRGFIRFVELSLERAPKEILECVNQTQHPSIPVEMLKRAKITHGNVYAPELDVHDLLESIQSFSAGTISIEAWVPYSSLFFQCLDMLNIRSDHLRIVACILVNSERFFSTPINRILDFEKFYNNMQPLLPTLIKGDVGLMTYAKLGSILKGSVRDGIKLPSNMLSYLTDKDKAAYLQEFIGNLQFLIIHNHMDLGTVDMVKRCDCTALKKGADSGAYVASCTGCI